MLYNTTGIIPQLYIHTHSHNTHGSWPPHGSQIYMYESIIYYNHRLHIPLHHLWYLVSHTQYCHLPFFEVCARFTHCWSTTSSLVSPHDTWWSSAHTNSKLAWVRRAIVYYKVYAPFTQRRSTKWLKCIQIALDINMLNIIFLLPTKTQNYHLKYLNVPW